MNKKIIAAFAAALALPVAANAAEPALSYTYGELGYTDLDQDGFGIDGLALEGSYEFMQQVFGFAGYDSLSGDGDFDTSTLMLGIGYAHPFTDKIDGVAKLSLLSSDFEVGPVEDDDTGFGLEFGVRAMVAEKVEVFGSVSYFDIYEDSSNGFELGGRFWFMENFGLSLAYSDIEDTDGFTLAGRYNF